MRVRHQKRGRWPGRGAVVPLSGLLLVLAAGTPARAADTTYKIQPLAKVGDTIGGVKITGSFSVSAVNDHGDLAFLAAAGPGVVQALFSVTNGQVTPLVVGGGDRPDGPWPKGLSINPLVSINQAGDIAFSVDTRGVYLWSAATKKFTPQATVGMPATDGLTFTAASLNSPSLNNRSEVAIGMSVNDAAGNGQIGLFLRNAEGKLLRVALTGQELPDGSHIGQGQSIGLSSLNDAGIVGGLFSRTGIRGLGAYLWEQGTLTPVALPDTPLTGGAKITQVVVLRLNNRNREGLVALHQSDTPSAVGLYRYSNGQLTPIVLPGQDLPDGSKLKSVREFASLTGPSATRSVSRANELGQYAFVATLEGGGTGVFLLDVDGKLSLILKTGMSTDLGQITSINPMTDRAAVGLNSQGQVALSVKIANGPETLVLLTPEPQAPGG